MNPDQNPQNLNDQFWINQAIKLAEKAKSLDEVPVAAIVVKNNSIISKGYNQKEHYHNPLGHAEMIAIYRASRVLKSWRLVNCTLYVTLEPCVMCAGAIIQSRIPRVVFGAKDPKGGACGSVLNLNNQKGLNHKFELVTGVLEEKCSEILSEFFKDKRTQKKKSEK